MDVDRVRREHEHRVQFSAPLYLLWTKKRNPTLLDFSMEKVQSVLFGEKLTRMARDTEDFSSAYLKIIVQFLNGLNRNAALDLFIPETAVRSIPTGSGLMISFYRMKPLGYSYLPSDHLCV